MRKGRRAVIIAAVLVAALGMAGYWIAGSLLGWGVPVQYDKDFYARGQTTTPAAFSYDDYAAVLNKHVDDRGMVHYAGLKADRSRLDSFARALARVDANAYGKWPRGEKIAFWINAYNALTLKLIVDHYPIKAGLVSGMAYPKNSIQQIPGRWSKIQYRVLGRKMTLNQIEHDVLRAEFDEPRIHVALVCAAMSCPPLRDEPYAGKKLDSQLVDQARKFLADSRRFRIDPDAGKVYLSAIFQWFGKDFVGKHKPKEGFAGHDETTRAVLHFVSKSLPAAGAKDKKFLREGKYKVGYLKYDWSLNERLGAKVDKRAADPNKDG